MAWQEFARHNADMKTNHLDSLSDMTAECFENCKGEPPAGNWRLARCVPCVCGENFGGCGDDTNTKLPSQPAKPAGRRPRGTHRRIKVVLVLFSQGDESQNGSDKFNLLTKWCGSGVAPVVKVLRASSLLNKAQIKPNLGSNQCWISAEAGGGRLVYMYKFLAARALLFVAAFVLFSLKCINGHRGNY